MNDRTYYKVSYIGLRQADGGYLLNVPLYVNTADICIGSVDEIIHRITETMNRHYEQQISNFFKTKGVNYETNSI
jgi:hypothetical protein